MKTVHSFAEMARIMGYKVPAVETADKPRKCFKCGAPMKRVGSTNVMACTGEVELEKNGKKYMAPCNNFILTK